MELEGSLLADEEHLWWPESSLALAWMLHAIVSTTPDSGYCACDARKWKDRALGIFAHFEPGKQVDEAVVLFDKLIECSDAGEGLDCDCGGMIEKLYPEWDAWKRKAGYVKYTRPDE